MHSRLLAVVVLSGSVINTALAADPKIAGVSADANHPNKLIVFFDAPFPAPADVSNTDYWLIMAKDDSGVHRLAVENVDASSLDPKLNVEKSAVLTLGAPLGPATKLVDGTFVNSKSIVHFALQTPFETGPAPQPALKPCSKKSDCDLYVTGSYTAGVDTTPLYALDAFAGYMWAMQGDQRYYGKIGFYGQTQTKSSVKVDPNSFLTYAVYQRAFGGDRMRGPFQLPILNFRFAGAEFNRTGGNITFVSSPVLTLPVRLSGKLAGPVQPGLTFPVINLLLGTEFVRVEKSALAPTGVWHTRGLLGATFAAGLKPKKELWYSVQLTSSYQVRLPSAAEIYYDPKYMPMDTKLTKAGMLAPRLGTQARHSIDTKLTYNAVEWLGFTFEHTYGDVPPSFVKTNHTFAMGLTFTLQESSFGRYSILRP